jgi:hypothetical protein
LLLIFLSDEEGILKVRVEMRWVIGHARFWYHIHDTLLTQSSRREGRDVKTGVVQR